MVGIIRRRPFVICTITCVLLVRWASGQQTSEGFDSSADFISNCTDTLYEQNPDMELMFDEYGSYINDLRCSSDDDLCDEPLSFHSMPLAIQFSFALVSGQDLTIDLNSDDLSNIEGLCSSILASLIFNGWVNVAELVPSSAPSDFVTAVPSDLNSTTPSFFPSILETSKSEIPTSAPSNMSNRPSIRGSTTDPSAPPSLFPSIFETSKSEIPTSAPSITSNRPSIRGSTTAPSAPPSLFPSIFETSQSESPTISFFPSSMPSNFPSIHAVLSVPSASPSIYPSILVTVTSKSPSSLFSPSSMPSNRSNSPILRGSTAIPSSGKTSQPSILDKTSQPSPVKSTQPSKSMPSFTFEPSFFTRVTTAQPSFSPTHLVFSGEPTLSSSMPSKSSASRIPILKSYFPSRQSNFPSSSVGSPSTVPTATTTSMNPTIVPPSVPFPTSLPTPLLTLSAPSPPTLSRGNSEESNDEDPVGVLGIVFLSIAGVLLFFAIIATYVMRITQTKNEDFQELQSIDRDNMEADSSSTLFVRGMTPRTPVFASNNDVETPHIVTPISDTNPKQNFEDVTFSSVPQFVVPSGIYILGSNEQGTIESLSRNGSINSTLEIAIENGDWAAVTAYARMMNDNQRRPLSPLSYSIGARSSISMSNSGDRTRMSESDQKKVAVIDALVEGNDWEAVVETAEKFSQNHSLEEVLAERGIYMSGMQSETRTSSLSVQPSQQASLQPSTSSSSSASKEFGSIVRNAIRNSRVEESRKKMTLILEEIAPRELCHVDAILEQFDGREDELVKTLTILKERREAEKRRALSDLQSSDKLSFGSTTDSSNEDVMRIDASSSDDSTEVDMRISAMDAINSAIDAGDWNAVQKRASSMHDILSSNSDSNLGSSTNSSYETSTNDSQRNEESHGSSLPSLSISLEKMIRSGDSSSSASSSRDVADTEKLQQIQQYMDNEDWEGLVAYTSTRKMEQDDRSSSSTDHATGYGLIE